MLSNMLIYILSNSIYTQMDVMMMVPLQIRYLIMILLFLNLQSTAIPFAHLSQHSNHYGLELMLKLPVPKHSDTVLDIVCGSGIVSCEFANVVFHVTGIDLTPAMIEQAHLPYRQKSDCIISIGILVMLQICHLMILPFH